MEQKFFDAVNAEIRPLLSERGFSETDGAFWGDGYAFKVAYNDSAKVFELLSAEVTDKTVGEYATVTSYLFDEGSTVNDAAAVGIDFNDTVASILGVNKRISNRNTEVTIPTKSSGGQTLTVEDLCGKMLAIFPARKEEYKDHVRLNGEFLCVDFFLNTFANDIRDMLVANNQKKLKKLYDALNDMYVNGDRTVGNLVVVVLLGGAVKNDRELTQRVVEGLSDHAHLKTAFYNLASLIRKDKRLKEIYGI